MKPCNGGLPTPSDPCFNASCARCRRHRIDTSSIGRHMVREGDTLICHDCAAGVTPRADTAAWACLYCRAPLEERDGAAVPCPMPDCVEQRARTRKRMGVGGERLALQARYNGMQNRAMRDKLERGECVDLSDCKRSNWADPNASPYYIVPPHVWQDDIDYCDAVREAWIHSVGRHLGTREIHAALDARFYENDAYECIWLR